MSVDSWSERIFMKWFTWWRNAARTPWTHRAWSFMAVNILLVFASVAARMVLAWNGNPDSTRAGMWVTTFAAMFTGFWASVGILSGLTRRQMYRDGWLEGRRAMVDSMHEARINGVDEAVWLSVESINDARRSFLQ